MKVFNRVGEKPPGLETAGTGTPSAYRQRICWLGLQAPRTTGVKRMHSRARGVHGFACFLTHPHGRHLFLIKPRAPPISIQ